MDDTWAELVLREAKKGEATYAEARLEDTQESAFVLKNGVPHISGYNKSAGIGIRVSIGGSMAFASTNRLEKSVIMRTVRNALRAARASRPIAEKIEFSDEKTHRAKSIVKQKIDVRNLSPSKKFAYLKEIEDAIMATRCNVVGRQLAMGDSYTEKLYVNSEGSRIHSILPQTHFTYTNTIEEHGRVMQRYWQYGYSGGFEMLQKSGIPKILADETKELTRTLRIGIKPPKGALPVVIGPQIMGIVVHESAGHPGEADRIFGREAAQAGESFLDMDSLGKQIGSDILTIIDDPTTKGSYGFYEYDDEGVKAGKRYLYKDGKIGEFLHNRESARKMGVKSNAAARSSGYEREPIVRMANTYVQPGNHTEEELFDGIKKGVYIKTFMEWNIDDKRFNQKYVGAQAYLIENGKISAPVFQPVLEMTTPKLYSSIDAIGNNIEFHAGTCGKGEPMQGIAVWFGGPSVRLKNIILGNP